MKGTSFFENLTASPQAARLHPQLAAAFRDYLKDEKAVEFNGRWVVNTHFPPFPGRAFDALMEQMLDTSGRRALFSVTLAVTNRCPFSCWHCYNAGRAQHDLTTETLRSLAAKLQAHGATMVTFTGGEPLLRDDLEEICRAFDDRTCLIVGTTGYGLTAQRARALHEAGVFGMGISLDAAHAQEHDRLRRFDGAFEIALHALRLAGDAGLYPYIVSVATREFLQPERFYPFLDFAKRMGAREVHLLEPCPTGRLAGHGEVALTSEERALLLRYQHEVAHREDLPVLSTFAHLESPEAFGCGAGLTHIYIDGSGELCPCNLVPLSFGNVCRDSLDMVFSRMSRHFQQPRTGCVGRSLTPAVPPGTPLPLPPDASDALCARCLPREHTLPRFFCIRQQIANPSSSVQSHLTSAYDRIHAHYDDFWTVRAGIPAQDLVERLPWNGDERVFEAGCGSGVATVPMARKLNNGGHLLAVDVSALMQQLARQRIAEEHLDERVSFLCADALATLRERRDLHLVFSTWVLGYIPLTPFIQAAAHALRPGGRLAFLVHTHNSPRREFALFAQLAARDLSVLTRPVDFGFPRDVAHIRSELSSAHLTPLDAWQDSVVFHYDTAEEVLDHLLKSGAGTFFYDAVDPQRRDALTREFLDLLRASPDVNGFDVRHDYVACMAQKHDPNRGEPTQLDSSR